jgi:hypothetical protein
MKLFTELLLFILVLLVAEAVGLLALMQLVSIMTAG